MENRFIDPKTVPKKNNTWFLLYHTYSTSKKRDKEFEKHIDENMEIAKKIGVDRIIVEDNFRDFRVGDYEDVWHPENYRYLVDSAHKRGMEVYLYVVIGEVATHSDVYKEYKDKWAVKGFLGREYCGFTSIVYQGVGYEKEHDHITKVFCIGSEWRKHLLKQALSVMDKYGLDGVYVDRVCYRINCNDKRHGEKGHFNRGIILFLRDLSKELKKRGKKMIVVDPTVKPSSIFPDDVVREYVRISDSVLLEVFPKPMSGDMQGLVQKFYAYFGGQALWHSRHLVRPIARRVTEGLFRMKFTMDSERLTNCVNNLRKLGAKDITIFSLSNNNPESFKDVCETVNRTGASICFVTTKKLSDITKQEFNNKENN